MCGIAGIVHAERERLVERPRLEAMAESLRHRGPDDEGIHIDRGTGLAHRRLSIIDLSELGRQPMSNEEGTVWVVFNGAIYNYLELRQRLLSKGHTFRSHTDTEVLVHLYEEEGAELLRHLNGMFAFAIWDARERRLFAARDRFGIKPFYYAHSDRTFAFASEIKALFRSGIASPRVDRRGLADYLTFQFCLGGKTLFEGVRELPPAHSLTVDADGTFALRRYWDLDFTIDTEISAAGFESRLLQLIEDAVRLQLRADVPVGAHLSGGLDSSTVTSLAAKLLGAPMSTFSGGFHESPEFDETGYARLVAQRSGTDHHEVFPGPEDFVRAMPGLMYSLDQPLAGPGVFPQLLVSRMAREHVKVVLGGQGGDEVFGGYTRYLIAYLEQSIKGGIEGTQEEDKFVVTFDSILPNLRQIDGYQPLLRHFWANGLFESEDRRYMRLIDRSSSMQGYINPEALPAPGEYDLFAEYREFFHAANCKSLINKMTRFDMLTLLPSLLQVEDRTSMAVALESRVPLLDHRIAELVASMPPKVKFNGGRSKHIFRNVVRHIVPPEISARKDKMGFPVPLTPWLRSGPVREFVRDTLLGDHVRRRGFVQVAAIEGVLDGEAAFGRGVWGLLCLELWQQAFFDAPLAVS
jgi:asparagine synthase (glutamine-hydrolysing)